MHIENICSRNYVHVDSGRRLVPTKLGIVLVHGYQKVRGEESRSWQVWLVCGVWASLSHLPQIDPQLVQPTMRSAVEEQLNLIAKGKVSTRALPGSAPHSLLPPSLLPRPSSALHPPSLPLRQTLTLY